MAPRAGFESNPIEICLAPFFALDGSQEVECSSFLWAAHPKDTLQSEKTGGRSGVHTTWDPQIRFLSNAGSGPTAYLPMKYELKADVRFYEGGSIYPKVNLGLFPWLMIGGGVDMRNVIGYGPVTVGDDSAKADFKLRILEESDSQPALALGWDGPAFSYERLRGLYLSVSKELKTGLGFWQVHAGVNTWSNWKAINLRDEGSAYAAVTTLFSNLYLFCEYDDALRQDGGYLNAGFRFTFEPISLGIEFRDLGARHGGSGRLLRVGYTGLF